jgi:hypothetical protein
MRAAAFADLGAVFAVVHVADPVQPVLDDPVAADESGDAGGAGLGGVRKASPAGTAVILRVRRSADEIVRVITSSVSISAFAAT